MFGEVVSTKNIILRFNFVSSVRTDLLSSGAVSRLHISGASHRDSGNYTCQMGRTAQASIELQIIPGVWG